MYTSKSLSAIVSLIFEYGYDILTSERMQSELNLVHHRHFNCFEHSLSVACVSVWLAKKLKITVNMRSLIRGALLHDYFLYDWREGTPGDRMHGFGHARIALKNAKHDYEIDKIHEDIIIKHMFPLNIKPPRYRESVIVTIADKICATCEIASFICKRSDVTQIQRYLINHNQFKKASTA